MYSQCVCKQYAGQAVYRLTLSFLTPYCTDKQMTDNWTRMQAEDTYAIKHWGGGYYYINEYGHLAVRVLDSGEAARPDFPGIDLYELSQSLQQGGLSLPVLVRFPGILKQRVHLLNQAFAEAIESSQYQGNYSAIYPIKVNQQRSVVQAILSAGLQSGGQDAVGLEAGSKPELMAVMALAPIGSTIICNGYKDREYIRLALIGQQLGLRVYMVIEKASELEHIVREAADLDISPRLGVRVRLSSLGAGKWQNSGGARSKFGLSAGNIMDLIDSLRRAGMLHCLELLHFHMGSQISNIQDIHNGMREAARYYVQLVKLGVPLRVVDVGGGLGVDYEGSRSRSFCSMNYSVEEYAQQIVQTLAEACDAEDIDHPDLLSESGRALTAHHALLITNLTDVELAPGTETPSEPDADADIVIQDLWQVYSQLEQRSVLESWHDATWRFGEACSLFDHGVLDLASRALAEQMYYAIAQRLHAMLNPARRAQRQLLDELNEILADKYFFNFSLFQSLPDVWAIEQVFPIMPLHRLDEQPDRRVVLQDLTCDSDGRIDQYVDHDGLESTLPLHTPVNGEAYLIGLFLVGAYQEILGDMHNLFGDTDSVNVIFEQDGYRLEESELGDTVDQVLRHVHLDAQDLLTRLQEKADVQDLDETLRSSYLDELEAGLRGYTYLEE